MQLAQSTALTSTAAQARQIDRLLGIESVTSLSYLGNARLLVLMSRLYLYYRLAYSHLPDLPRT
jgi:hypothetical protein